MSEELKKGIPKAIPIGKKREFTEEEKEYYDMEFERILKKCGAMKENESIKDWEHLE